MDQEKTASSVNRTFLAAVAIVVVVLFADQLDDLPTLAQRLPDQFQDRFLGNEIWKWCGVAALLAMSVVAGLVSRFIFRRVTRWRDRSAPVEMSKGVRAGIVRAAGLLGGSLFAVALLPDIALRPHLELRITIFLSAIAVVGGTWMLIGWWDAISDTLISRASGHRRAELLLVPVLHKMIRALLMAGGMLFAVGIFFGPKTIEGMVAGLGITGVVVALAAKDSVENIFGSITILFDMPFAIGDWVRINKVEGAVEEINLRSTRIRTAEDTLINLPNANLITAAVENFGARRFRRQKMTLRLSYQSDPGSIEKFCGDLREYINGQEATEPGKTIVEMDDPQVGSVGVVVMWFLNTSSSAEEFQSRNDLIDHAMSIREKHGITFATASS